VSSLSDRYTSQSNFFEPFGLSFSVARGSEDYLGEVFAIDVSFGAKLLSDN
jgi:hypothetical protein